MTARKGGTLALEYLHAAPVHGGAEHFRAALADLRALMAERDRLSAEEIGLTKERNVARDACEALTAMRDRAEAERDRLRAALDGLLFAPNSEAARAAAREAREGVKP